MKVRIDISRIKQTKWHEYAVRFVFGGTITALAEFLAHKYGPSISGLFLAFPAILPASITLIQDHDGRRAAWADVRGAAIGSIGMLGFAIVVWVLAPRAKAWEVILCAAFVWFAVSVGLWLARQPNSEL